MYIRIVAAAGLALSLGSAALAETCDCKSEIPNARGVFSGSCTKIWSSNSCTLRELGASTARILESPDAISSLEEALGQIDAGDHLARYGLDGMSGVVSEIAAGTYILNVRSQCIASGPIRQDLVVMALIDPALSFDDGEFSWLFDPRDLSSLIVEAIDKIAEGVCTSSDFIGQKFNNILLVFGARCLAYGTNDSYVIANLGNLEGCPEWNQLQ